MNQTGPGYKKIIDYKNIASDDGFYFLNNYLNFYPLGTANVVFIIRQKKIKIDKLYLKEN